MTGCHDFICGNVRPGEPFDPDRDCRKCWAAVHNAAVRAGLPAAVRDRLPEAPVRRPARSLPVALPPCVHEGAVIEPCKGCPVGAEGRHVRQCFHPAGDRDRCTREPVGPAVQACRDCRQYEAPVAADHRAAFLGQVTGPTPAYPGGTGRGIVTAGEGDYWPGVVVLVRMLRRVGCTLPVEVFYRSKAGRVQPEQLAGLDCTLIDLDALGWDPPADIPADRPEWAGWAAKLEALHRSRFERVLWLDSDLYPVRDPSFLLDLPGDFLCWSDADPSASAILRWPEVWAPGPGLTRPIQSGQVVLDRRAVWRELCLTRWLCQRAGHFFHRMLGDQDALRVAFAAAGHLPTYLDDAEHVAGAKHTYILRHGGEALFVHRSGTKMLPGTEPARIGLPGEADALAIFREVSPVTVNMGCWGLGDGVQGMLAVGALARSAGPVVYKVGPRAVPFVQLFDCGAVRVEESEWDHNASKDLPGPARQANRGYWQELRTRGAKPRVRRYMENVGARGDPVMPRLKDPGQIRAAGQDWAGAVVLCPFSYYSDREWSVPAWRALDRMLTTAGFRTVILADDQERATLLPDVPKVIGAPADRVAGVLLNAACVVGLDSGLSHLAGALGAPTVVLTGQTSGECVFSCYPSVRWIDGPLPCKGCWWQSPYSEATCKGHCPSLYAIGPHQVYAAVETTVRGSSRLARLATTTPFRPYTEADDAEQLRHLDEDGWLYGGRRYVCSILGAVHEELIQLGRPDLAKWTREAVGMARRMHDQGGDQDRLDWATGFRR